MEYLGKTKLYKIFEHYFGLDVLIEEFKYTVEHLFEEIRICSSACMYVVRNMPGGVSVRKFTTTWELLEDINVPHTLELF